MEIAYNLERRQKRLAYWLNCFKHSELQSKVTHDGELKANLQTYALLLARQARAIIRVDNTELAENEQRLLELDRLLESTFENIRLCTTNQSKPNFSTYYE